MLRKRFESRPCGQRENLVADLHSGDVWHRVFQRVPYADTDRANVVYHANYLRYFEVGRTEMMRSWGCVYSSVEAAGYLFPVVATQLNYLRSLRYDDPAWIYTRPGDASDRVRFTFEYLVCHADTHDVMCAGSSTHCTLSNRGRPVEMEPPLSTLWRNFPRIAEPQGIQ